MSLASAGTATPSGISMLVSTNILYLVLGWSYLPSERLIIAVIEVRDASVAEASAEVVVALELVGMRILRSRSMDQRSMRQNLYTLQVYRFPRTGCHLI